MRLGHAHTCLDSFSNQSVEIEEERVPLGSGRIDETRNVNVNRKRIFRNF